MGLFSTPPPLDEEFRGAVSAYFFLDEVAKRDQRQGMEKVAKAQSVIRSALGPGEQMIVIVPCFAGNTGYDGLAVVTTDRLLHLKGSKVQKQMRRSDLAGVERRVTQSGTFLVQFVSRSAAPFSAFAGADVRNKSTTKYWEGTIQLNISSEALMEDLIQKAEG